MAQLVLIIAIIITNVCTITHCYTCETPEEWLEVVTCNTCPTANIRVGSRWPDGVVPYKFHHSLTLRDITEVRSAFEEYESKTCIGFQPWKEGDLDYVSLEVNDSVCGVAHVCRKGGYQFAQFGKPHSHEDCRSKATMIHELGHTICLGHEEERADRDKYLHFSTCSEKEIPLNRNRGRYTPTAMYDYSSQMHAECYWCGGGWPKTKDVTKCGLKAGTGLSVLDVDQINLLYDCQGCHRHRWQPTDFLFGPHIANMYNFGYKLKDGTPLFPCRAPFRSGVSSGRYDIETNSCHIGGRSQTYVITEGVEVLTIPGGLNNKCSIYKLRDRAEVTRENGIVSSLSFKYTEARGYVAYGALSINGSKENALGKVWLRNNTSDFQHSKAELQVGTATALQSDYKVLTCSLDETCLLQKSYENRRCPSTVPTAQVPVKREVPKKIVCYVNSWAMHYEGNSEFSPDDIDPHLCTHLIYYSAKLENNVISVRDPHLDLESGIGHDGYQRFTNLKKQNPRIKTLIAIGAISANDTVIYSQMVANDTSRRIFVNSIIPFMKMYGFDGLDLFWLHPHVTREFVGISPDRYRFSNLVQELREAFSRAGKNYLLTAALRHDLRLFHTPDDVPRLGWYLDFLSVRSYTFTDLRQVTRHVSPLYRHSADVNYRALSNVNDTVTYWLQAGFPKEKLIMGMMLQGIGFTLLRTEDHGLYAPATGQGFILRGYNQICKKFKEEGDKWKISINKLVKAPYTFKGHQWIGYEDVESLYYKAEYARNMDLGGAMVWYLDADDFKGNCHNESYILVKTIVTTLNGPRIPERPEVVSQDE